MGTSLLSCFVSTASLSTCAVRLKMSSLSFQLHQIFSRFRLFAWIRFDASQLPKGSSLVVCLGVLGLYRLTLFEHFWTFWCFTIVIDPSCNHSYDNFVSRFSLIDVPKIKLTSLVADLLNNTSSILCFK